MNRQLNYRLVSKALFLSGALFLAGCVSIPESIKGTSATPVTDLNRVFVAPELYIGQEGRFGGRVIDVKNLQSSTQLEIAVMPLSQYDAAPELRQPSIGRLYANVMHFLDPTDYKNQYVTVVGTIKGVESGKVGEATYPFLRIDVTGMKRWTLTQQVIMPAPVMTWGYYGDGPYWWGYHNGYGGYGGYPYGAGQGVPVLE
ncbi:Slp family lipoprotein [Proteus penneri]|uniref:Slp family lipoprotein n=1 Tax=Proteus penneri TaxID=102862 RepID=UPI0034D6D598